jgi:hypothetical protein
MVRECESKKNQVGCVSLLHVAMTTSRLKESLQFVTSHRLGRSFEPRTVRLLSILCLSCLFKGLGPKRRIVLSAFYL